MKTVKLQKGYIAISTVLIISAVVMIISISVTMLSIGSAQGFLALTKGGDSLGFIDGCVEDGLLKSQASIGYTGGAVTRPEGACEITISKNNTVWTMTVSTADPKFKKTVQVVFDRTPTKITLVSQKEI